MWSLPDIQALNAQAATQEEQAKILRMAEEHLNDDGEPATCEHCEDPPDMSYLWYDIFSDEPKGVIHLCEKHDSYYGHPTEGFFYCGDCGRVYIENYTSETYSRIEEEACDILCLNCARARYLEDPENWIGLRNGEVDSLDFERIRKSGHVLAVGQDVPEGLRCIGNVEFDAMTGGRLTSSSSCESTPDGGVEELRELLQTARAKGHSKALLILDAAYQFAVSVGVYVPFRVIRSLADLPAS